MGKSTTTSNDLLKLVLNGTTWANIAQNASVSPLTNLFVALHTADPGVGGLQTTNETAYTSYGRATVARTTGGFTASTAASSSPVAAINFAACTGGSSTITHASIGGAVSGGSVIYYSGAVTPNISISSGVTPQLTTSSTITEA